MSLKDLINSKYGNRPAEWRATREPNFENWNGVLYSRKDLIKMITNSPGNYIIQPYYRSVFRRPGEFGEETKYTQL